MALFDLQKRLQSIYEIETEHAVTSFTTTNAGLTSMAGNHRLNRETVFVSEEENFLNIAVYLDAELVTHLEQENPSVCLNNDNLEDFCLATEGISHFLKLVWHGEYDRSVSQLELELQAEIDKFVLMYSLLHEQGGSVTTREIRQRLFESVTFLPHLSEYEKQRYEDANFYAGKYCHALEKVYLNRESAGQLLNELRRFYRLPLNEKLRRINKLN